jgi:hypothetical protein
VQQRLRKIHASSVSFNSQFYLQQKMEEKNGALTFHQFAFLPTTKENAKLA